MTPPRRPEDVTEEEVRRACVALAEAGLSVAMTYESVSKAIARGLIVPPPRERTQMEKDEEEWSERRHQLGSWTLDDAQAFDLILARIFPAATAAGVTY